MIPTWNEADVRVMWLAGKSAQEIAHHYGLTRNAVCGRLFRLGLRRSGLPVKGVRTSYRKEPKPPKPPRVVRVLKPKLDVPAPVVINIAAARPFLSRGLRECAWMLDDGTACCNPSAPGVSYCPGHRALVYRPTTRPDQFERSLRRYTA